MESKRIALSCLQDLNCHAIPAYRFWGSYFKNGIVEAGHSWTEVPEVDWAEGITNLSPTRLSNWRDYTWSKTIRYLTREREQGRPVDVFLSYLYPVQIDSAAIRQIQGLGVRCVNFFCDNIREFSKIPPEFESFDLHWVPEWEALEMYKRAKLTTCFAPMPCWIPEQNRTPSSKENGDVTFIGSCDELRRRLLAEAMGMGARIMIGGSGWGAGASLRRGALVSFRSQLEFIRRRGLSQSLRRILRRFETSARPVIPLEYFLPPIDAASYMVLTQNSTITLGINRVPTFRRSLRHPLRYSRLRDIEAPMMGACYLTEWTGGLGELYDIGTEIETYRTAGEMVTKINELRQDPVKRRKLRERGQRRALTDLSIPESLRKMLVALGLGK